MYFVFDFTMCFLNWVGFCQRGSEVQGRWKDFCVYEAPVREGERGGVIFCLFALVSADESYSEVWFHTALPVKHHRGIMDRAVIPKHSKPLLHSEIELSQNKSMAGYLFTDPLALNQDVIIYTNGETMSQWQERKLIFRSYIVCHSLFMFQLGFVYQVNWISSWLSSTALLCCLIRSITYVYKAIFNWRHTKKSVSFLIKIIWN